MLEKKGTTTNSKGVFDAHRSASRVNDMEKKMPRQKGPIVWRFVLRMHMVGPMWGKKCLMTQRNYFIKFKAKKKVLISQLDTTHLLELSTLL